MDYSYQIFDTIEDDKRSITIIDRETRFMTYPRSKGWRKWYKYRCNKCKTEGWLDEYSIKFKKQGCNACLPSSAKITIGINDLATTEPWMVSYLKNPEDAHRFTASSGKKVECVCPYCGRSRYIVLDILRRRKYLPCICSDNRSFPNKFMYALLSQLDLSFENEKMFPWSDNRKYDDYIEHKGLKIIVEQNGMQHYNRPIVKSNTRSRSVEEEKKNDEYKRRLALENGIDFYFEIDCRKSEPSFIRKNINESGLLQVLGVDDSLIDWDQCVNFATSNFAKMVCDYKNNHPDTKLTEIAEIFKMHRDSIYHYKKKVTKWVGVRINQAMTARCR